MLKLRNTKDFQQRLFIRVPGPGPSLTACHLPCPGHKDHRVAGFLEKCAKYFTNAARDRNFSWCEAECWLGLSVIGVGEKTKYKKVIIQ